MWWLTAAALAGCPVERIAADALPSVLRIDVVTWANGAPIEEIPRPLLEMGARQEQFPGVHLERGRASGFVVDGAGHVVTAAHVVAGHVASLTAVFVDGSSAPLTVVGVDPTLDVAILALPVGEHRPPLRLGDEDRVGLGGRVVLVGWPLGTEPSVSVGAVTGLHMALGSGAFQDFLQTDAAFNHGNSGGPLMDCHGRVVGLASFYRDGENLGFAVPVSRFAAHTDELIATGTVARGYLPIVVQELTPAIAAGLGFPGGTAGGLVAGYESPEVGGGPVLPGDVITEILGEPVTSFDDVFRTAFDAPIGTVAMTVWRGGQRLEVQAPFPADPVARPKVVPPTPSPSFGLLFAPVPDDYRATHPRGVVIAGVSGVSEFYGDVRPGDKVLSINGFDVADAGFAEALLAMFPGVVILELEDQRGLKYWTAQPRFAEPR